MLWLPIAISSYFLSGLAAFIDKVLLTSRIPEPLTYAFYTSILSVGVVLLVPFGFSVFPLHIILLALSAGATLMVGYYFFYRAMRSFEASRVVPLTAGVFTPIFTLIISFSIFSSSLETKELLAFILFVVGGLFFMIHTGKQTLSFNYLLVAPTFISGLFFAISFSVTKEVFEFSAVFILLIPVLRKIVFTSHVSIKRSSLGIFLANKIIGAFGFLLLNYAIFLGSEKLVVALKGIEYLFVFFMTLLFSIFVPVVIRESLRKGVIVQKFLGVVIIGAGLFLYTFPFS